MKKVYEVVCSTYECRHSYGVFTSEKLANEYMGKTKSCNGLDLVDNKGSQIASRECHIRVYPHYLNKFYNHT